MSYITINIRFYFSFHLPVEQGPVKNGCFFPLKAKKIRHSVDSVLIFAKNQGIN